jgi:hypothetical protein
VADNPLQDAQGTITVADSNQVQIPADSFQGKEPIAESSNKILTQVQYQEPVVKIRSIPPPRMDKNNLLTSDIIHREYFVATQTIGLGIDTQFAVRPIELLLSQHLPLRIFSIFRMFRFKTVKLKFLHKALPQQYGFFMISRFPWIQQGGTYHDGGSNFTAMPVVGSLTSQQAVEVEVPWISNQVWHGTPRNSSQISALEVNNMWTIVYNAFNPSRISSESPSAYTVDVLASFTGVELTRPDDPDAHVPTVEGQMYQPNMELPMYNQYPEGGGGSNIGRSLAVLAASTLAGTAITKPFQWLSDSYYGNEKERGSTISQQGITQATHGNASMCQKEGGGSVLDLYNDDHVLDPAVYSENCDRHSLLEMCKIPQYETQGTLHSGDNPVIIKCVPIRFDSDGTVISLGYMAYLAQYFRRWRGGLKYLIKFTTSPFVSARLLVRINYGSSDTFVAGSVGDYTSQIITVKGDHDHALLVPYIYNHLWQWTNQAYLTTSIPTLEIKLLSIEGSGDIAPAIKYQIWSSAADDFVYDSYQMALYSTADPPPKPRPGKVTSVKTVEGQMDMRAAFAKSFEDMPGFNSVDTAHPNRWNTTMEDLLYRWSSRGDGNTDFVTRVFMVTDDAPFRMVENWDRLVHLFLYNSGSVRRRMLLQTIYGPDFTPNSDARFVLQSISHPGTAQVGTYSSPCHGIAATDLSKWPVVDFSTPFISTVEVDTPPGFYVTNYQQIYPTSNDVADTNLYETWVKAGTNFQLFYLMPLPDIKWWPWYVAPASKRNNTIASKIS